jgi:hypothetical protein
MNQNEKFLIADKLANDMMDLITEAIDGSSESFKSTASLYAISKVSGIVLSQYGDEDIDKNMERFILVVCNAVDVANSIKAESEMKEILSKVKGGDIA